MVLNTESVPGLEHSRQLQSINPKKLKLTSPSTLARRTSIDWCKYPELYLNYL